MSATDRLAQPITQFDPSSVTQRFESTGLLSLDDVFAMAEYLGEATKRNDRAKITAIADAVGTMKERDRVMRSRPTPGKSTAWARAQARNMLERLSGITEQLILDTVHFMVSDPGTSTTLSRWTLEAVVAASKAPPQGFRFEVSEPRIIASVVPVIRQQNATVSPAYGISLEPVTFERAFHELARHRMIHRYPARAGGRPVGAICVQPMAIATSPLLNDPTARFPEPERVHFASKGVSYTWKPWAVEPSEPAPQVVEADDPFVMTLRHAALRPTPNPTPQASGGSPV